MIYQELVVQYKELLENLPQRAEVKKKTFFDIAGFPHYENVISNWYQFYFDANEEHGLGNLFLESIISLLAEKLNKELDFTFDDVYVYREVATKKGNFIDLVIQNSDSEPTEALIIENKIFADIYNDLTDYYESIKSRNKIGVVLTLSEVKLKSKHKEQFVCLTHSELLERVKSSIGNHFAEAESKHLILLADFINNLNSFQSNNKSMEDNCKFYLDNIQQINELINLKNDAEWYIVGEMRKVAEQISLVYKTKNKASVTFHLEGEKNIISYWWLHELVENNICFQIWLHKEELIDKWKNLANSKKEELRKKYKNINWTEEKEGTQWLQIADYNLKIEVKKVKNIEKLLLETVKRVQLSELMAEISNL